MPDTFTTYLNLDQPEVGADDNTWGGLLNADLAIIDALFAPTGTGTVIVRDSSNRALVSGVNLTKAVGNTRTIDIFSGASLRWQEGVNSDAEGGSNVGSDWMLRRYADDGVTLLATSILVERESGLVTFETNPAILSDDGGVRPPVGTIVPFAGTTAPSAYWLLCFGQTFVTASYPALTTLLGTKYNTGGEGGGNARLPDLRDIVISGLGNMGGTARGLLVNQGGKNNSLQPVVFGEEQHTLVTGEMPVHNHGVTDPGHTHLLGAIAGTSTVNASLNAGGSSLPTGTGDPTTQSSTTGISIQNAGSGSAHNNLQPSLALAYLIRALP
jgi:microcystin-dependent protein